MVPGSSPGSAPILLWICVFIGIWFKVNAPGESPGAWVMIKNYLRWLNIVLDLMSLSIERIWLCVKGMSSYIILFFLSVYWFIFYMVLILFPYLILFFLGVFLRDVCQESLRWNRISKNLIIYIILLFLF